MNSAVTQVSATGFEPGTVWLKIQLSTTAPPGYTSASRLWEIQKCTTTKSVRELSYLLAFFFNRNTCNWRHPNCLLNNHSETFDKNEFRNGLRVSKQNTLQIMDYFSLQKDIIRLRSIWPKLFFQRDAGLKRNGHFQLNATFMLSLPEICWRRRGAGAYHCWSAIKHPAERHLLIRLRLLSTKVRSFLHLVKVNQEVNQAIGQSRARIWWLTLWLTLTRCRKDRTLVRLSTRLVK